MGAPENKALVRRIIEEGMNEQNGQVLEECLAGNFVNHDMPLPVPGPEGFRQVLAMFQSAFPDMHVNLEDILAADDDKVVTRGEFTGTHKGDFMGVPPSGEHIRVKFMDIWRIDNGRATDNWVRLGLLGLMQQIGAVPA
jgi:steroid delta-isomerase-like uncharacterized protein